MKNKKLFLFNNKMINIKLYINNKNKMKKIKILIYKQILLKEKI